MPEGYHQAINSHNNTTENKNPDKLCEKGKSLHEDGKYSEAIKYYEKALQVDPNYPEAWEEKGRSFSYLGKNDIAERCYKKAIDCCENILKNQNPNDVAVKTMSTEAE